MEIGILANLYDMKISIYTSSDFDESFYTHYANIFKDDTIKI